MLDYGRGKCAVAPIDHMQHSGYNSRHSFCMLREWNKGKNQIEEEIEKKNK